MGETTRVELPAEVETVEKTTHRGSSLIEGCWYWVTDGEKVWPAAWVDERWSNLDTWEDFEGRVCGWQVISGPPEPEAIMEDFQ